MYEHRRQELQPRASFLLRLGGHALAAFAVLAFALGLGVLGYHGIEGMAWIDALLNASMILGGMGPVDTIRTLDGKLFASFYALFSGVLFLVGAGILLAPVVHRFLHRFHIESGGGGS
jgi:hypothetical protein